VNETSGRRRDFRDESVAGGVREVNLDDGDLGLDLTNRYSECAVACREARRVDDHRVLLIECLVDLRRGDEEMR